MFNIQTHKEITSVETVEDSGLGIMKWGRTNSFPQTLKNLVEQSPNAKPAVSRTSKFYKGAGFEGQDEIVSPTGITLRNVVSAVADDYALFEAFAIHCNYNLLGVVTSMVPLRIAELRFNRFDELNSYSKLGYHPDFGMNAEVKKQVTKPVTQSSIKWLDRFNPTAVLEQVKKAGSLSKYSGQILYFSETGTGSYPVPPLQAPINYVLSDIENSILVRKETSTGFINTYILKTMLDETDENFLALCSSIESAQGARGTGKVITMTGLSEDEMKNTVLEKIDSGGAGGGTIIENATTCYDLDQRVINGAYLIPPLLSGAAVESGFSQSGLKDAYFVFNAVTQFGRDSIEAEITRILKNSIFNTKELKINKLSLDTDEAIDTVNPEQNV
jgi:hypothetical protein